MTDERAWAMDLDERGRPFRAHLIVRSEEGPSGEIRTAACGEQFTAATHPRGWWSTRAGRFPLQDHAIHCGQDQAEAAAPPVADSPDLAAYQEASNELHYLAGD